MSASPDLQLDLQKLKEGDEETIQSLVSYLTPRLKQYLAHLVINEEDVFDIIQDFLVRIIRDPEQLAALGSQEKIIPYCMKLARNAAIHRQRSIQRETALPDDFEESTQEERYLLQVQNIDPVLHGQVVEALQKLPQMQQQVLHLLYFQGLTPREVAAILDLQVSSVRMLNARALHALREHLIEIESEAHEQ